MTEMNFNYQIEAIQNGATHTGERGHCWMYHSELDRWYVYRLGAGWYMDAPTTALTPISELTKHLVFMQCTNSMA